MNAILNARDNETKENLETEIKNVSSDKYIHLLKADEWYRLQRKAKQNSRKDKTKEAIVFDYGKNYHVPNITTNDVHYILCSISTYCLQDKVFYMYILKIWLTKEVMRLVLFCITSYTILVLMLVIYRPFVIPAVAQIKKKLSTLASKNK